MWRVKITCEHQDARTRADRIEEYLAEMRNGRDLNKIVGAELRRKLRLVESATLDRDYYETRIKALNEQIDALQGGPAISADQCRQADRLAAAATALAASLREKAQLRAADDRALAASRAGCNPECGGGGTSDVPISDDPARASWGMVKELFR